ncbi:MAG: protein kinase [Myxococcales bacterium]|nr:protein kinase [Myxococcales bacterium]MDD9967837.1 protein kinase [Myxococcales bacterium]
MQPRESSASREPRGDPDTIGAYRVVRELGRGGMGVVYQAVHARLGKAVAIKTLRGHMLDDEASVQRFFREGRAACRVVHPNVVAVHELGDHEGTPYLVMDLLKGEHLGSYLERRGPLPLQEMVDLLLPIISGVSAAHEAGVVHRDLKPSNLMLAVGHDGHIVPKVLDFGTSKLAVSDSDECLTSTGAVLGTLHYMSPEQVRAPQEADALSDQYSLGAILYECATGRRPFVGEGCYELMQAIMSAPVERPSARNPIMPVAFDAVVRRAMGRRPEERFQSVAALGAALLPFASPAAHERWAAELTAASERASGESELASADSPEPNSTTMTDTGSGPVGGSGAAPDPVHGLTSSSASSAARPLPPKRARFGVLVAAGLGLGAMALLVTLNARDASQQSDADRATAGDLQPVAAPSTAALPTELPSLAVGPASPSAATSSSLPAGPLRERAHWAAGPSAAPSVAPVAGPVKGPAAQATEEEPVGAASSDVASDTAGATGDTEVRTSRKAVSRRRTGGTATPRQSKLRKQRTRSPALVGPAERSPPVVPEMDTAVELGDNGAPIIE